MINQQCTYRHPLDPVTIVDSHALMTITVGAMMSEVSAEEYLLDLIDRQSQQLHEELGSEMIRPWREMTPEGYAALYAGQL